MLVLGAVIATYAFGTPVHAFASGSGGNGGNGGNGGDAIGDAVAGNGGDGGNGGKWRQ
jgi:hypothetical protein